MDTIHHAPVPPQAPRHRRIFAAGALAAAGVLAGGIGLAANSGEGEPAPVEAAAGTMPHVTTPETAAPVATTIPETTTSTTSTTLAIDRRQTPAVVSTSTTTEATSTTTAAPAPTEAPTSAPTTLAPETTTTTEVEQLFELPEFGAIPASMSEKMRTDTFYINIDGSGSSGGLLRVDDQIVGGPLAAHSLPAEIRSAEDQAVVQHYGAITMQQGETVTDMESVATIAGFLVSEDRDFALAVAEGVDPETVLDAYAQQLAEQRPQLGDIAYVSGFSADPATGATRRNEQPMIYIGSKPTDNGSPRDIDVYVSNSPLIGPGNSGGQIIIEGGANIGTLIEGEAVVRQPDILDTVDILQTEFGVNLEGDDIQTIVMVEQATDPAAMSYVAIENTNRNEIYAEQIAAITKAAHEQLLDPTVDKQYVQGILPISGSSQLVGEGGVVNSDIKNPVFCVDQQGNAILYGQDIGGEQLEIGAIQFFPADSEAVHLSMQAPEGLTKDMLLGSTNGVVTSAATMTEYPDYLTGLSYVTPDGETIVIGEGVDGAPANWASYEIIIANGTITLVEQATDTPPVPTTTPPTTAP